MQDMKTERNKEIAKILETMDGAGFDVLVIESDGEESVHAFRRENVYHLKISIDKGAARNPLTGVKSEKATTS